MSELVGDTSNPNRAAVFGNHTDGGTGVFGKSKSGWGIDGESETNVGVMGRSTTFVGVWGEARNSTGVFGKSKSGWGINGESETNIGVMGKSNKFVGVWGETTGSDEHGVYHPGVLGVSKFGDGIMGDSTIQSGVYGRSAEGEGVYAESQRGVALVARKHSGDQPALYVNHRGAGNLIAAGDKNNVDVFWVSNSGNVYSRGVLLTCDKNVKENFSNVNTLQILDKLTSMPIQSWNYKEDTSDERHIGPTAQDFHATFGLNGEDDMHVSSIDLQGIALAAIQGLNEKLMAENAQLHASLANMESRLSTLESKG
ncbi:hypothetical protein CN943_21915 [Bacillus thuringiensis]|uniref:tail fiber domain-containing protein n=1 Tax=Bacillus thuringiensis TaxID=1428 RepID=UPI000BFE06AF|nr:tail fiber domain-containing protein [Bacillus thuringiensis]PGL92409.1 hypothetical protein CN943_21915 [Bacillus thuringiensis]